MAHPTCALARLPVFPPAAGSPLQNAVAELGALRETHRAIVRINDLLQQAPHSLRTQYRVDSHHVNALIALLKAVLDERFRAAKATIESMQAARDA